MTNTALTHEILDDLYGMCAHCGVQICKDMGCGFMETLPNYHCLCPALVGARLAEMQQQIERCLAPTANEPHDPIQDSLPAHLRDNYTGPRPGVEVEVDMSRQVKPDPYWRER